jgi:tyrosyl-tRNA synthetase
MNFIEELQWRGMIHTMMPGTEEQLAKEMTTAYVVLILQPIPYILVIW